jgi:hypothetical protein
LGTPKRSSLAGSNLLHRLGQIGEIADATMASCHAVHLEPIFWTPFASAVVPGLAGEICDWYGLAN